MSRRVVVELILNARNYLDESKAVRAETAATERTLHGLGSEADSTSHDMAELAANTDVAKHQVDDLGDKSRGTARDLTVLDERIKATQRSVMALGFEFAATGDAAAGKKFGQQQSLLAKLEALKASLTSGGNDGTPLVDLLRSTGDAAAAGQKVGQSFLGGLSSAFDGMGPAVKGGLIAGLVASAVLALPAIGAAVAGAVTGVAGVGGIAGGIFAASKDPVVRSAATQFGGDLSRMFFGSGATFVDPIRKALALLEDDFAKLDLKSVFAQAAPFVVPLAAGIGDLVKNTMPGFMLALQRGAPFIAAMATGLSHTGIALSEFLDNVSRSHGAIEGLEFLFMGIAGSIKAVGAILGWLSDRFHDFNVFMHGTLGVLDKALDMAGKHSDKVHEMVLELDVLTQKNPQLIDSTRMLGDAFAGSAGKADDLAQSIRDADKAQDDFIGTALTLAEANTAVGQGFLDVADAVKKNGKHWNDNTAAAYANQQAVEGQIDALRRQRQAAIDSGNGTTAAIEAADVAYNKQLDALLLLAKQAGATKAQLQAMATTYTITFDIRGLRSEITQSVVANKIDKDLAKKGFASGGTTPAFEPFTVGEHGPETMWASQQHFIATAQQWSSGPVTAPQIVVQNNILLVDPMTGQKQRAVAIDHALARGVPQDVVAGAYP